MQITVRETKEADLDFVLAADREPVAAPLIGQWSRERFKNGRFESLVVMSILRVEWPR